MNEQTQYQTIKSLCLEQMIQLRTDPKPTYNLDGQWVSWESYVRSLQATIDWCDQKLLAADPVEVQSIGVT